MLKHWIPDVHDRDLYICGPDEWTARVVKSALDAGVPHPQIHVASFTW